VADERGLQLGLLLRQGELRTYYGLEFRPPVGWPELREMAQAAEAVDFDSLFVADHLLFRNEPPVQMATGDTRDVWECFTLLSALAASTERVGLGPLVACTGFRNPGLLAKIAQTLDEVSGGRFILGLGAGWHRPEYEAYGYPYDRRVSRFEEALAILAPLLREGEVDFDGRFSQARAAEFHLGGGRRQRLPIWIGGGGPRMLRLAARYADAFNTVWYRDASEVAEPFARLETACREIGRDPASVGRTSGTFVALPSYRGPATGPPAQTILGPPDQIAASLRAFQTAGIQHLTVVLDPWTVQGIEQFGEIIRALRG
jgi:probable F420-dependent oxidoreductase